MLRTDINKKEVNIIILDIEDITYDKLTAFKKIELLSKRIVEICEILKVKKPVASWVVAWREYGIRDSDNNSISNNCKTYLKKTMINLSLKYPNLIIIAGTVLTRKRKSIEDVAKIKDYYQAAERARLLEIDYREPLQVQKHKDQLEAVCRKTKSGVVTVLSNKARVYFQGIEKRHGKLTPFDECSDIKNSIYQPAKGNNLSSVISFDQSPSNMHLGIDICREHASIFSQLKHSVESEKKSPKPLLHFVISATIPLILKSACAELGVIHVDSAESAKFILMQGYNLDQTEVHFYECGVMNTINTLGASIELIYPVQFKLLDRIDHEIDMCRLWDPRGIWISSALRTLRNEILATTYPADIEHLSGLIGSDAYIPKQLANELLEIVKQGDTKINTNQEKVYDCSFFKNNSAKRFPEEVVDRCEESIKHSKS